MGYCNGKDKGRKRKCENGLEGRSHVNKIYFLRFCVRDDDSLFTCLFPRLLFFFITTWLRHVMVRNPRHNQILSRVSSSNLSYVKMRVPGERPCICDQVGVLLLQEISNVKSSQIMQGNRNETKTLDRSRCAIDPLG